MMSLLAEFTKTAGVGKVPLPPERTVSLRPRSQHEPQIGQGWHGDLPAKTQDASSRRNSLELMPQRPGRLPPGMV